MHLVWYQARCCYEDILIFHIITVTPATKTDVALAPSRPCQPHCLQLQTSYAHALCFCPFGFCHYYYFSTVPRFHSFKAVFSFWGDSPPQFFSLAMLQGQVKCSSCREVFHTHTHTHTPIRSPTYTFSQHLQLCFPGTYHKSHLFFFFLVFIFSNVLFIFEREHASRGGTEREGSRRSGAGSVLTVAKPDGGARTGTL